MLFANPGTFYWCDPKGNAGVFRPKGPMKVIGSKQALENPMGWESTEPMLAARIITGFKIGNKVVWKLKDLIELVRRVRMEQAGDPGASFVLQKGMYRHEDTGETIVEPGAQVIILNLQRVPYETWKRQMKELADTIAIEFEQELVILEIQRDGMTVTTMGFHK